MTWWPHWSVVRVGGWQLYLSDPQGWAQILNSSHWPKSVGGFNHLYQTDKNYKVIFFLDYLLQLFADVDIVYSKQTLGKHVSLTDHHMNGATSLSLFNLLFLQVCWLLGWGLSTALPAPQVWLTVITQTCVYFSQRSPWAVSFIEMNSDVLQASPHSWSFLCRIRLKLRHFKTQSFCWGF